MVEGIPARMKGIEMVYELMSEWGALKSFLIK
jgi:hypothetical protein